MDGHNGDEQLHQRNRDGREGHISARWVDLQGFFQRIKAAVFSGGETTPKISSSVDPPPAPALSSGETTPKISSVDHPPAPVVASDGGYDQQSDIGASTSMQAGDMNKEDSDFQESDSAVEESEDDETEASELDIEEEDSDSQEYDSAAEESEGDEMEASKNEMTQLSESVFIYQNRKMSDYGNVYEGEIRSGVYGIRVCAIKIGRKSEQTTREARILSKINSHTHVISIIESGIYKNMFEERVYIALDKCHEHNLHQHIMFQRESGVKFNLSEALEYSKQIITGVTYLHKNLIMHKDLKPTNILLSHDKRTIKLADFNLSQEIKSTSSKVYSKHQFGTNGFRPIESFGDNWVSLKSDIFSLGVVLYFVLSNGKSPFSDDKSLWDYNIQNGVIDLSHLLVPNANLFEHLIKFMLSKERCRRPSIWEVADHPCWTGKKAECNFDYGFTEEIDHSDDQILEESDQDSNDIDSQLEMESRRELLRLMWKMGIGLTRKVVKKSETSVQSPQPVSENSEQVGSGAVDETGDSSLIETFDNECDTAPILREGPIQCTHTPSSSDSSSSMSEMEDSTVVPPYEVENDHTLTEPMQCTPILSRSNSSSSTSETEDSRLIELPQVECDAAPMLRESVQHTHTPSSSNSSSSISESSEDDQFWQAPKVHSETEDSSVFEPPKVEDDPALIEPMQCTPILSRSNSSFSASQISVQSPQPVLEGEQSGSGTVDETSVHSPRPVSESQQVGSETVDGLKQNDGETSIEHSAGNTNEKIGHSDANIREERNQDSNGFISESEMESRRQLIRVMQEKGIGLTRKVVKKSEDLHHTNDNPKDPEDSHHLHDNPSEHLKQTNEETSFESSTRNHSETKDSSLTDPSGVENGNDAASTPTEPTHIPSQSNSSSLTSETKDSSLTEPSGVENGNDAAPTPTEPTHIPSQSNSSSPTSETSVQSSQPVSENEQSGSETVGETENSSLTESPVVENYATPPSTEHVQLPPICSGSNSPTSTSESSEDVESRQTPCKKSTHSETKDSSLTEPSGVENGNDAAPTPTEPTHIPSQNNSSSPTSETSVQSAQPVSENDQSGSETVCETSVQSPRPVSESERNGSATVDETSVQPAQLVSESEKSGSETIDETSVHSAQPVSESEQVGSGTVDETKDSSVTELTDVKSDATPTPTKPVQCSDPPSSSNSSISASESSEDSQSRQAPRKSVCSGEEDSNVSGPSNVGNQAAPMPTEPIHILRRCNSSASESSGDGQSKQEPCKSINSAESEDKDCICIKNQLFYDEETLLIDSAFWASDKDDELVKLYKDHHYKQSPKVVPLTMNVKSGDIMRLRFVTSDKKDYSIDNELEMRIRVDDIKNTLRYLIKHFRVEPAPNEIKEEYVDINYFVRVNDQKKQYIVPRIKNRRKMPKEAYNPEKSHQTPSDGVPFVSISGINVSKTDQRDQSSPLTAGTVVQDGGKFEDHSSHGTTSIQKTSGK